MEIARRHLQQTELGELRQQLDNRVASAQQRIGDILDAHDKLNEACEEPPTHDSNGQLLTRNQRRVAAKLAKKAKRK